MLIFLNLLTDLDASEQNQNLGMPVPGATCSEASLSSIPLGDIRPFHLPQTFISSHKCANNPPSWMRFSLTNMSADPHVNVPPVSEGDTPGASAPFQEDSISTFFPMDTDAMNEGTCGESVVQVPTIYAIVDISLNTMLLADVPGKFQLNYLTT